MTNERPISKEHAEVIWAAVLAMTEKSQKNIFETAKGLIAARRMLDQSVALQQAEKEINQATERIVKGLKEAALIQSLFTNPESRHTHESDEKSEMSSRAKNDMDEI